MNFSKQILSAVATALDLINSRLDLETFLGVWIISLHVLDVTFYWILLVVFQNIA